MSMISALIDELNKSADEWNSSNMFELARMCREAADTIWQLRDDLQRTHGLLGEADREESRAWDRVRKAEAEADRLREERDMYRDLVGMMDHPDLNAQLNAENAKLRELAGRMLGSIRRFEVCSDSYRVSSVYEQWMRELGVEVDG